MGIELGNTRSAHGRLASELEKASEAGDAEQFLRLSMWEWALPGRLAELVKATTGLRVELARARLASAEAEVEEAMRTQWTAREGLTATSKRDLTE